MKRYMFEVRVRTTVEVEAENEDDASEMAYDAFVDEVMMGSIDGDWNLVEVVDLSPPDDEDAKPTLYSNGLGFDLSTFEGGR